VTRNEAIVILQKAGSDCQTFSAPQYVDAYVALGMLKLDEPKSINDRLYDQLVRTSIGHFYGTLLNAIDAAGLKLTEK
jgi:hypothetical protein